MAFDDEFVPPPENPPKVIYHRTGINGIPEECRRIFGTPPPPNSSKPEPPPPLPPNSYHKKPKYWQMRGTGHMSQTNRIAFHGTLFLFAVSFLIYNISDAPNKIWTVYLGQKQLTAESIEEERRKNKFWFDVMRSLPDSARSSDMSGEHFINLTKIGNQKVRWDIREVDRSVRGIVDMGNPMDDPL